MSIELPLSDFQSRISRSSTEANIEELLDGRRWNLLQAVAWVASENDQLVCEVGRWCPPNNALPHSNPANGARMTLSDYLHSNPETAMPFGVAQVELMELMKSGGVLCYVDHDPCYLTGYVFNGFTYHDDYVGLSPPPDDRYWGYVVVDAATMRKAWAARKEATRAVAKTLPASEGAVFTKLTAREVNDWYQERVRIATSNGFRWSRDEDESAGRRKGVTSATIRELRKTYAPSWGKGSKPTTKEALLKATFLANPDNLEISN